MEKTTSSNCLLLGGNSGVRWVAGAGDGAVLEPHATRSASSLLAQSMRARICEVVCAYSGSGRCL